MRRLARPAHLAQCSAVSRCRVPAGRLIGPGTLHAIAPSLTSTTLERGPPTWPSDGVRSTAGGAWEVRNDSGLREPRPSPLESDRLDLVRVTRPESMCDIALAWPAMGLPAPQVFSRHSGGGLCPGDSKGAKCLAELRSPAHVPGMPPASQHRVPAGTVTAVGSRPPRTPNRTSRSREPSLGCQRDESVRDRGAGAPRGGAGVPARRAVFPGTPGGAVATCAGSRSGTWWWSPTTGAGSIPGSCCGRGAPTGSSGRRSR